MSDLGLIRSVLGVPAGIFKNIALDHQRSDAIVVAHPDERTPDVILLGQAAEFRQHILLATGRGDSEGSLEPDVRGDSRLDQRLQRRQTQRGQHLLNVGRSRTYVTRDECIVWLKEIRL